MAEFRDLLTAADSAVRSGDVEAIDRVLGRVLEDFADRTFTQAIDVDEAQNWAGLLVGHEREHESEGHPADLVAQAINRMCVELCLLVARDRKALRHVDWRQLEQVLATALDGLGFDVELTPPSKDGGKDIVVTCHLRGRQLTYYVEVKHWRSGKRVGAPHVFDFVEINVSEGTDGGLFLSSSGFTHSSFSQLSEMSHEKVRLGGEDKIVSLCQHFTRQTRGIWRPSAVLPKILFEQTVRANAGC